MAEWPSDSNVVLELVDYAAEQECELRLTQTAIPGGVDAAQLKAGWLERVFRPMSILCGYPIVSTD